MGLFFEVWEVNDPAKIDEHDKLCEEWILEYVHTFLGESALPHRLYSQDDNPSIKAMSVEYPSKADMEKMMETLFSDKKFMNYYKEWEKYLDEPAKRYFFDELSPNVMMANYSKAKGI
jgi:hypothetical protein